MNKARQVTFLGLVALFSTTTLVAQHLSDGPLQPREGWRTQVERRVDFDGRRIEAGQSRAEQAFSRVRFIEEPLRVVDGRVRETRFQILEAREGDAAATTELATPGTRYILEYLPNETRLRDAETGGPFANAQLDRLMGGNLAFDLWPRQPISPGLSWSFAGQDLARRLAALRIRDGRLHLRVTGITREPHTGLRTAAISGRLNAQIDYRGMVSDYGAQVDIQLPLPLGIPFRMTFDGRLFGKTGKVAIAGNYRIAQTMAPSRALLADLKQRTAEAPSASQQPAADPSVDQRDENGRTRLMKAALQGDEMEVGIWLGRGADPNALDPKGRSAVFYAVATYRHAVLRQILAAGANPDRVAGDGTFPLVLLATAKDFAGDQAQAYLATVQALLDVGAKPDARHKDGMTSLMYAALNGNSGLTRALLARGADPTLRNQDGFTALDIARAFEHGEVVGLLAQ